MNKEQKQSAGVETNFFPGIEKAKLSLGTLN